MTEPLMTRSCEQPQTNEKILTVAPVIIGAGWLGTAIADALGVDAVARRSFSSASVPPGAPVVIASGRSAIPAGESADESMAAELDHLRTILDACVETRASRVVVLGSSDVAGLAATIDGQTPQAPRGPYGIVKAAMEDECVLRHAEGQNIVVVRLAPVHGLGKARTESLGRMARWPVIPLPNGGRHSVGFVLLDDAVAAIRWLLSNDSSPVVSVGAGQVLHCDLFRALAHAQGKHPKILALPGVPGFVARGTRRYSEHGEWILRIALPRAVAMEVPVPITPLSMVAERLLLHC